LSSSLHVVSKF